VIEPNPEHAVRRAEPVASGETACPSSTATKRARCVPCIDTGSLTGLCNQALMATMI
jgi:hypothetical protein